ncbi:MAG: hypothetical protein DMG06_21850 [Acidobacteria bacterium]|nr:MAG: hypothetical protein DMG06_21850 [Acidobacteriota bacterium]
MDGFNMGLEIGRNQGAPPCFEMFTTGKGFSHDHREKSLTGNNQETTRCDILGDGAFIVKHTSQKSTNGNWILHLHLAQT